MTCSYLSRNPKSRHSQHRIFFRSHFRRWPTRSFCVGSSLRRVLRRNEGGNGPMEFTQLATGFCLIEAPRWDGSQLWFTDILLGGFRCLRPDGHVDSWLTERKIIGGLALK